MTEKAPSHIETELAKFTITDVAIVAMGQEFMPLRIDGIDDKEGYSKVHAARMVVKGKRVEVEKTRKALKADALAFGKIVDTEAKRITELLQGIESHLAEQQVAVDNEKERIKRDKIEAILAEQERVKQAEIDRIAAEEEAARLEREKAMAAEEERLEAERVRQEKVEAEQRKREADLQAVQDKIDADQRAILAEKERVANEQKQQVELEKVREEAAERGRIEAEEKAEKEAYEKAAAELKAKVDAERQEALKPDKDKLIALADALGSYPLPMVKDLQANIVKDGVGVRLDDIVAFIKEFTDAE